MIIWYVSMVSRNDKIFTYIPSMHKEQELGRKQILLRLHMLAGDGRLLWLVRPHRLSYQGPVPILLRGLQRCLHQGKNSGR